MDGGASLYLAYAAAAVAAASAVMSAQASSADSKAQAEQARLNAEAVRQQNAMREDFVRQQSGAALGEQRASAAQSGFDPSSGALLKLPSPEAASALTPTEARQVIQAQSADFGAYRARLASGVPAAAPEAGRSAAGAVRAEVKDSKAAATGAPDKLTLSKGGAAPAASGADAVAKARE